MSVAKELTENKPAHTAITGNDWPVGPSGTGGQEFASGGRSNIARLTQSNGLLLCKVPADTIAPFPRTILRPLSKLA
jgi:hypothetical protein